MSREIPEVETTKVKDLIEAGYRIIDVRRGEEFNGDLGHIKGSQLVTIETDLEEALKSIDKNQKIIFVCRSGSRSGKATSLAIDMGFTDVFNMVGGMLKWNEEELEVEK